MVTWALLCFFWTRGWVPTAMNVVVDLLVLGTSCYQITFKLSPN